MRAHRPIGAPTRGKTAPSRLRAVDVWLCAQERALLQRGGGPWRDAVVVDLGYGRLPWTTAESFRLLRTVAPQLEVVGLEIDPERVAAAQPWARPGLSFRRGGFELPVERPIRAVRALNVLRQYDEPEVEPAWARMAEQVLPGGLIVEGTSDPHGRLLVVQLLRKTGEGLAMEGLLFHARLRAGFEPEAFKAVLPKRWIHRVVPGEPVYAFFEAWAAAWRQAAPARPFGPRQTFRLAAQHLSERVAGVDRRHWLLRRGYLLWRAEPLAAALSR